MGFREQSLQIIRDHPHELAQLGVVHSAIFGSVARGDDRLHSDVDIMIEGCISGSRTLLGGGGLGRSQCAGRRLNRHGV